MTQDKLLNEEEDGIKPGASSKVVPTDELSLVNNPEDKVGDLVTGDSSGGGGSHFAYMGDNFVDVN